MKTEIKEKWVAALRSGEYQQTKGHLRTEEGFCCLGVLCDLVKDEMGLEWSELSARFNSNGELVSAYEFVNEMGLLPVQVQEYLDFDSSKQILEPKKGQGLIGYLSELNDDGFTFAELADLIEAQL